MKSGVRYLFLVGLISISSRCLAESGRFAWVRSDYYGPKDVYTYLANEKLSIELLSTAFASNKADIKVFDWNDICTADNKVFPWPEDSALPPYCSNEERAKGISKELKAQYGAYGSVSIWGDTVRLDACVIRIEDGLTWRSAYSYGLNQGDLAYNYFVRDFCKQFNISTTK